MRLYPCGTINKFQNTVFNFNVNFGLFTVFPEAFSLESAVLMAVLPKSSVALKKILHSYSDVIPRNFEIKCII